MSPSIQSRGKDWVMGRDVGDGLCAPIHPMSSPFIQSRCKDRVETLVTDFVLPFTQYLLLSFSLVAKIG